MDWDDEEPELPFADLGIPEFAQAIQPVVQQGPRRNQVVVGPGDWGMLFRWRIDSVTPMFEEPVGSRFRPTENNVGERVQMSYDMSAGINLRIPRENEVWNDNQLDMVNSFIMAVLNYSNPRNFTEFRVFLRHLDERVEFIGPQTTQDRAVNHSVYFDLTRPGWQDRLRVLFMRMLQGFVTTYEYHLQIFDRLILFVDFAPANIGAGGARNSNFPTELQPVKSYLFNPSTGKCFYKCLKHFFSTGLDEIQFKLGTSEDYLDYGFLFQACVKAFPDTSFRLFNADGVLVDRLDPAEWRRVLYLICFDRHWYRITNIDKFIEQLTGNKFHCENCDRQFSTKPDDHVCMPHIQCENCKREFDNQESYDLHKGKRDENRRKESFECTYCGRTKFFSETCHTYHLIQCNARFVSMEIEKVKKVEKRRLINNEAQRKYRTNMADKGLYPCTKCKKHNCKSCFMEKRDKSDPLYEEGFAFDYEAMLIPHPELEGVYIHKVNRIDVQQWLPNTHETWGFTDMGSFVQWLRDYIVPKEHSIAFYAHNLKGYDGRLTLQTLLAEQNEMVEDMCWEGAKILKFKWHNILFRDSLTHISQPLSSFPKTFGLTELHKGFFPYKFNSPANQNYIGPMPALEYYEPHFKSEKDRKALIVWYQEHQNDTFDLQKELELYCKSDVDILARSLEIYNNAGIELNDLPPLNKMTIAAYTLDCWWVNYFPEKTLAFHNYKVDSNCREALRGGRTDVRVFYRKYSLEDVFERGKYGRYIDVQSMYPYVMFAREYPVGHPEFRDDRNLTIDDVLNSFGYCKIDIQPPDHYVHHPVLVHSRDNRLCATLEPWIEKVWCTPEIWKAIEQGWKITKIHWIQSYPERRSDMFKNYLGHLLAEKIHNSSECPQNFEELAHSWRQAFGIEIKRDKFQKNPGKRAVAKTQANSFWGKMCEKFKNTMAQHVDAKQYIELENKEHAGQLRVTQRFKTGRNKWFVAGELTQMDNSSKYSQKKHRERTCPSVGVFVPMWGRMMLWEEMNKLGKRVMYHDTDSIIYEYDQSKYNVKEGKLLGDWEAELDGNPIVEFVALAPKTYSYRYLDVKNRVKIPDNVGVEWFHKYKPFEIYKGYLYQVKEETKVKGIKLHSDARKVINFEGLLSLYTKQKCFLQAKQLLFKYDQKRGEITSSIINKNLIFDYEKGVIGADNQSFPFGVHRYWNPQDRNVEEGTASHPSPAEVYIDLAVVDSWCSQTVSSQEMMEVSSEVNEEMLVQTLLELSHSTE